MIETQSIGWWNTGFPLVLLGGLAVVMPRFLVPRESRSRREVAVAIWASAGLLLVAGAVVFAMVYAARGVVVWAALNDEPLAIAGFFLRLSGFAAMVWAPVLALVWLGLAQRVEKKKGEDDVRRDIGRKDSSELLDQ